MEYGDCGFLAGILGQIHGPSRAPKRYRALNIESRDLRTCIRLFVTPHVSLRRDPRPEEWRPDCDSFGRDVLFRLVYGVRCGSAVSMGIALASRDVV